MKRTLLIMAVMGAGILQARGGMLDKCYVVEITSRQGEVTYEAVTAERYEELTKEIEKERSLASKARALAEKEWKEGERTARVPFPRVPDRTLKMKGMFDDMEKANAKVGRIEEDVVEKQEKDAEREKARAKIVGRSKEAMARASAKEDSRKALEAQAVRLYEMKLQELLKPAEAKPEEEK